MKELIRRRARACGFDDCRVSSAASPDSAEHFRRWLASNRHGGMAFLQRTALERVDPQKVLAGARSLIALIVSYAAKEDCRCHSRSGEVAASRLPVRSFPGLMARYARYDDYHQVMASPLRALASFVNQLGGAGTRSLWYVDTGPVLERDFAQRAGMGFVGKHTNFISRQFGNWVFLGEILTTLELEPDSAEKNRCGACMRCMPACPTQAIIAPFQLDARRCISYLTIELKGSIPEKYRPAIGNRIFGCDDCLTVCPWNRFARTSRLMQRHARDDLKTPDLLQLLPLDEAGFKRRYRGTPIERSKRRGLLRNVCVALGNVGDASALPTLQRATLDPEPLVAEHAGWAVRQIASRAALPGTSAS